MRIKRTNFLIIIFGIAILSAACGKTKKDDIAKDLKENAGMEASGGNASEKDESSGIPATISYAVEEGGRLTKVDAKVYADGYGNVPTFAATEYEDKEEFVRSYAKNLFDNGEYTNVRPYEIMNREELEKELQFYKERYSEKEYDNNQYTGYIEWMLETYDEKQHGEYPDGSIVYTRTKTPDSGDESNNWTFTDENALLRGYVDGKMWNLEYSNRFDDAVVDGELIRQKTIPYLTGYCIDENYSVEDTIGMNDPNINNLCNRESAERQAKQLLGKIGLDDMELLHIVHNNVRLAEEEYAVDGYTMIFGMSKNGAHLLFAYKAPETHMDPDAQNIFAVQPYVEVQVNSNGVYGVIIRGIYKEPEVMSEKSEMLSFEQINEIAKEEFAKIIARDFIVYEIGSIEFGYLYITYDGLSYAVVPAWRYYEAGSERDTTVKTPVLTICALDGSVIYNDNYGVE